MEDIKLYRVVFGCGCTSFPFKSKKQIYHFCRHFEVRPRHVVALTSAIGGYVLKIVKAKKGLGWKIDG